MTETTTLTCPQCAAAYRLPAGRIPGPGKKLKCAACGHVWVPFPQAEPETAVTPSTPPEDADAAAQPAPSSEEIAAAPVAENPEPMSAEPSAPEAEVTAALQPEDSNTAPLVRSTTPVAPPALHDLAKPQWHAWVFGELRWMGVALLLAAIGLFGAGVAVWQQLGPERPAEIALKTEAPLSLPSAKPLKPILAPVNLVLSDVSASRMSDGSTVTLTVQGQIVNAGATQIITPMLRLELLDDEGTMLDFGLVNLVTNTLIGRSGIPFAVSLTDPAGTNWQLQWVE